jgi:hypothetical protein
VRDQVATGIHAAAGLTAPPPGARDATGIPLCGRVRLFPASRRSAISGRFSGALSRVCRSGTAADARPPTTLHPGRASMPTGPANPASGRELRRHPGRPRHGQRGTRRSSETIAGNMQGHNRDIGSRSSSLPDWRLPVRSREHGSYGPEQGQECAPYGDRSRRGGLMILISWWPRVPGPCGADSPHRTIY